MLTNGYIQYGTTKIHATSINYNPAASTQLLEADGYATAGGSVSLQASPTFTVTSTDVENILDTLSVMANDINGNSVKIFKQKPLDGGIRGTTCTEYAISKGLIVLNSLKLSQGTVASVTFTVYPVSSNGYADPVVITDNQAFDAATAIEELKDAATIGVASINGTALAKLQDVEINFGNEVINLITDGQYFSTIANLIKHQPDITLTGVDAVSWQSLATQKALKLNGTTGLEIGIKTTTNGVVTQNNAKTIQVKNGLVTLGAINSSQGSLSSVSLNVSIAHDRSDSSPLIVT
jgi:hypothetical protein